MTRPRARLRVEISSYASVSHALALAVQPPSVVPGPNLVDPTRLRPSRRFARSTKMKINRSKKTAIAPDGAPAGTDTNAYVLYCENIENMCVRQSEDVRYADEKPHVPGRIKMKNCHATSFGEVTLPRPDKGVNTPTNPKSPDAKGYIVRQRVSISGIKSDPSLNGKQGTLVEWQNQHWGVNINGREDTNRIKPDNLQLVRPGPDEPRYWPAGVHISELRCTSAAIPRSPSSRSAMAN